MFSIRQKKRKGIKIRRKAAIKSDREGKFVQDWAEILF